MSETFARECCEQFDKAMIKVYKEEYLRLPTVADLQSIYTLHKAKHHADGLFGSLDCTHTYWKNCPKAWQQSYKGKEKKCSIVLEAVSDYHCWFWHASYGYAGTMNDKNILNLSPLLERLLDGSFCKLEQDASVVPFSLHPTEAPFNKMFILVDGIYPRYSRFVRGIKEPIGPRQEKFTSWQEGARKDIERAFGQLKGRWQFLERPIHLHKLEEIGNRVHCCLILHNMCVSDRIMQGPRERYSPASSLAECEMAISQPGDLVEQQAKDGLNMQEDNPATNTTVGVRNLPAYVRNVVSRKERFQELGNLDEHTRLHGVLQSRCVANWN